MGLISRNELNSTRKSKQCSGAALIEDVVEHDERCMEIGIPFNFALSLAQSEVSTGVEA